MDAAQFAPGSHKRAHEGDHERTMATGKEQRVDGQRGSATMGRSQGVGAATSEFEGPSASTPSSAWLAEVEGITKRTDPPLLPPGLRGVAGLCAAGAAAAAAAPAAAARAAKAAGAAAAAAKSDAAVAAAAAGAGRGLVAYEVAEAQAQARMSVWGLEAEMEHAAQMPGGSSTVVLYRGCITNVRFWGRETRHGSRMFFFNVDLGNYHEDAYGEPMTAEFAWSMLHHEYKFI